MGTMKKKRFLVIVRDTTDDSYTEWVVKASDAEDAKVEAIRNRLLENGQDPDAHDEGSRRDKNGYVPVLVYDHEMLENIFPKRTTKPKPPMSDEEMVKRGIIVPAGRPAQHR